MAWFSEAAAATGFCARHGTTQAHTTTKAKYGKADLREKDINEFTLAFRRLESKLPESELWESSRPQIPFFSNPVRWIGKADSLLSA
jgi:hypothetical protein